MLVVVGPIVVPFPLVECFMRLRVLAFALFGLAICVVSLDAQATKKKKDDAPGAIEIFKNKDGNFRWRIVGPNNKSIAIPPSNLSWEKKADLIKALDELKTILNETKPVEVDEKADKKDDKKTDK